MVTAADVRELLEQAQAFVRAHDPNGAVARARYAARAAESAFDPDGDVRDEVRLALDRLEVAARAWREDVERRAALHQENERREAGLIVVDDMDVAPYEEESAYRRRIAELFSRFTPSGITKRGRWRWPVPTRNTRTRHARGGIDPSAR